MSTTVNRNNYSAPRLTVYGDVREITQTVGNSGNKDGGDSPGPTKTQI